MRHAKSDWNNAGVHDHDRPLNQRGIKAAKLMGDHLDRSPAAIDIVLASTAVRVQQTLEWMQKNWKRLKPTVINSRNLYLASPATILQEVSQLAPHYTGILVIGHNPGLEELARRLCGTAIEFPTACLAELYLQADSWRQSADDGRWVLGEVTRPRELK